MNGFVVNRKFSHSFRLTLKPCLHRCEHTPDENASMNRNVGFVILIQVAELLINKKYFRSNNYRSLLQLQIINVYHSKFYQLLIYYQQLSLNKRAMISNLFVIELSLLIFVLSELAHSGLRFWEFTRTKIYSSNSHVLLINK